jgi:hypothetical protein
LSEDAAELHRSAVENIFFLNAGGNTPIWLTRQADACSRRYGDLRLIPEFRSALNAFSDNTFKPFELFVLGEGKFGKSTLVNAMLGEARSKSRGLPETRCFLRYVITDKPRNTTRMYLRLQRDTHDWINRLVGQGKAVPDLFDIYEYDVANDVAKQILKEEATRLDRGGYVPAIYEAERDHRKTDLCIFPSGVRIVDTQGLDQLFPDDLQQLGRNPEDPDITKRLLDWMSNTPRGKHLEWQFRRCDAVLWCVNAKRIGSAATEASMKYFSSYSKKIVIALTNVDLVAKKEGDIDRLLQKAQQKYGHFARAILPINGQLALDSAMAQDAFGIQKSGLAHLAEMLTQVCVADAAKTRSTSRYLGLRQTETQFRNALFTLETELLKLAAKFQSDIDMSNREMNLEAQALSLWLDSQIEPHTSLVVSKIHLIDLSDDRNSSIQKMGVNSMTASLQKIVDNYFHRTISTGVLRLASQIEPYRLPLFDAEGERCGDVCALNVEILRPPTPSLNLWLGVRLEDEIFTRAMLWLKKKVVGFFSENVRLQAVAEERKLIAGRQQYVFDAFIAQWQVCLNSWVTSLLQQCCDMYSPIFNTLEEINRRIESFEGEPIAVTTQKLKRALSGRGSNSVFEERFLAIFKAHQPPK